MTRAVRLIGLVLLLAPLAVAGVRTEPRQTPPRRDAPAAAQPPTASLVGTGALGGVVTNDDGSKLVRYAYIVLIGTGTGVVKFSSTDADGKFLFASLPADRYTLGASKPPYLGTVAGARRPARMGTAIALADGQKIANVAIRMALGAAITGTVVDEKGQPVSNTGVAVAQMRLQNGERAPMLLGTPALTDERGHYRIFGLVPGEYLVATVRMAAPPSALQPLTPAEVDTALRSASAPATAPMAPSPLRYAPVYFPGTTRPADAIVLTLAAGDERPNVDFKLEVTRAASVSGTVIGADGQVPPRLVVSASTKGLSVIQSTTSAPTQPDGSFLIPNIMPGTYLIRAAGGGPIVTPGAPPQTQQQFALVTVEVSGDVTGIQLVMRPGVTLPGNVAFRGSAAKPALAGWRLPVRTFGPATVTTPTAQPANDAGAFAVTNLFPGTYLIGGQPSFGPTTDAITWSLESVVIDGRDVTDLPFEIGDTPPQNMVVTFTDRYQELSGRITNASGVPMSQYMIVVFPEDKAYWISGSRRILTTRPGTDGKFALSGAGPSNLPPGRYLLAAVTDIDRDEQYDPAFLSGLVSSAVPVVLQPGEKKVQDLIVR